MIIRRLHETYCLVVHWLFYLQYTGSYYCCRIGILMKEGRKRIAEVLMHPNISDFCKDIITIGFTKDYDAAVADAEVALECLKIRRDEALGTDWQGLKLETGAHLKCAVTTIISGNLAFGSGECDEQGFWENPCNECARDYEKQFPNDGPCWPFKDA